MKKNKINLSVYGMLVFSGLSYGATAPETSSIKAPMSVESSQPASPMESAQSAETPPTAHENPKLYVESIIVVPIIRDENGNEIIQDHHAIDESAELAEPEEVAEPELLPPFELTREAAEKHLEISDGLRQFNDETLEHTSASTPFVDYRARLSFEATNFNDGKLRRPKSIALVWRNTDNADWQPEKNESLCNTKETGQFEATVTAEFDKEVTLTKTYLFKPKLGICHLKPQSLKVQGEHNYSDDFDPIKGFSASTRKKFPTTAFKNATFDVVLNGEFHAGYYLRSSHQEQGVDVSLHYGNPTVTFKDKPEGVVTIELYDFQGHLLDTYGFSVNKWFTNSENRYYNWDASNSEYPSTEQVCNAMEPAIYRVASRAEVTNARFDKKLVKGTSTGNYYRRAIGEGLLPEWGYLLSYSKSFWSLGYYWLLENGYDKNTHFMFRIQTGEMATLLTTSTAFVICTNRR